MKLHELKRILDSVIELHGEEASTSFLFQKASGRTGLGYVTGYEVFSIGERAGSPTIRFKIDYPRGSVEE